MAGGAGGLAPETTGFVVQFVGLALMVVDGGVFSYYAARNALANPFSGRTAFWRYLVAIGITAVAFGATGLAGLVWGGRLVVAFQDLSLLLFVGSIAFALREIYFGTSLATAESNRGMSLTTVRRIELALFVVILLEWLAVVFLDRVGVTTWLRAAASVVLAAYGTVFYERLESLSPGTGLDTTRLHLFPILVMGGVLGVVGVGDLLGVSTVFLRGLEYSLVVLVGGLLLPASIRLQQNVGR